MGRGEGDVEGGTERNRSELEKEEDQEENGQGGGDWKQPLLIHKVATGTWGPGD